MPSTSDKARAARILSMARARASASREGPSGGGLAFPRVAARKARWVRTARDSRSDKNASVIGA